MGRWHLDLSGKTFDLLTVISRLSKERWLCRCECGGELVLSSGDLNTKRVKSCLACLKRLRVTA